MSKVAIIGAGAVGTTIAYTSIMRGLIQELVLVDVNPDKARAEVMDLNHGDMFLPPVTIRDGTIEDCTGTHVVIITAGAKQQPGQTRLELTAANARLFRTLIPAVMRTSPDALLLIVSNPVDVLTTVALHLSGLPPERVIGSGTVLDTSRLRFLLGQHFNVSASHVHAYIIGEHGDSEVAVWSSAQIGNVPLKEVRLPGQNMLDEPTKQRIFEGVRGSAEAVIKAKGATNWAVGLAVARILEAVLRNERAVLTVSRCLSDYHSVSDVCLSVPWVVSGDGAEHSLLLPCDESERRAFQASAAVIRQATKELEY